MDSSLLDIGAQCALAACPSHDFLPLCCPACSKSFCRDHIHSHACPPPPLPPAVHHHSLSRCALEHCNKPALDAYNPSASLSCSKCDRSFCAEHRHPTSHNCTLVSPEAAASPKNVKARALLAKISSSSTSRAPPKKATQLPTDPAKLGAYRKVEAVKMRHRAVPLDPGDKAVSLPLDQRLHVKVQHGDGTKIFWLRKTLITGRVLDLVCNQFGIKQGSSLSVRLSRAESDAPLRNDIPLSKQVDDGSTLSVTQHI